MELQGLVEPLRLVGPEVHTHMEHSRRPAVLHMGKRHTLQCVVTGPHYTQTRIIHGSERDREHVLIFHFRVRPQKYTYAPSARLLKAMESGHLIGHD